METNIIEIGNSGWYVQPYPSGWMVGNGLRERIDKETGEASAGLTNVSYLNTVASMAVFLLENISRRRCAAEARTLEDIRDIYIDTAAMLKRELAFIEGHKKSLAR